MSPAPLAGPTGRAGTGRGPRNAVVAVALLVLVLVVVLAALVRGGGAAEDAAPGDGPSVATPSAPARSTSSSAPQRSPSAGRASASPSVGARDPESGLPVVALTSLPREAQTTVRLVDAGGPFPYAKDGATFSNRERRLPRHPSGWYREYTVVTPGEGDRGARRIVTGDDDRLVFYTADHYGSFVRVAR